MAEGNLLRWYIEVKVADSKLGRISTMTRSELISALADRFPKLVKKDAEISVKQILEAVESALARRDRVEIRGFGTFCLNYHPERKARNPKTGESVLVAEKYVPHFRPAKDMRERVELSVREIPLKRAA